MREKKNHLIGQTVRGCMYNRDFKARVSHLIAISILLLQCKSIWRIAV
ncbi:TPA_asm: hypothetical protein HUJ06_032004 [Nelumbo nucifera]|uniref:Uncharacterized protein n=1 Tax=Nelumbo nucifera TaxID=4432 RepID=A0A822YXI6_NELNU|nr:TPA_asm: hypothetical protein HUJ06_008034 [Nelumbo nucifera]DAD49262.1 TPA_asm: hypothetical protein HUJ06_032004 [Nelumbo nucifera]